MSIPTPSLSHLTAADYRHVYEPAEDTFILLDALEQDQAALRGEEPFRSHQSGTVASTNAEDGLPEGQALKKRARLCVEIGSGSGCVSAFIGKILGEGRAGIISFDINPRALDCTQRTGKANEVHLEPVQASMLSSLRIRSSRTRSPGLSATDVDTAGLVDLLVFNPPYVPTPEEEEAEAQRAGGIAGSWAGGLTGTRLVDELIDGAGNVASEEDGEAPARIEAFLSPGGAFYLVAIRQNDPPALVERLRRRGLDAEIVLQRRAGREHLFIIRAINKK
ncbi:S-adenosylmethionine-dependent methyltransferase [Tilletia horrida]|nr:S-adenosylmethionine-dependent methyltransferase [Tilletia horrida]KAK0564199.1 S-adenosylmethionine-dependent methyltransferase [Tilletia horrida]